MSMLDWSILLLLVLGMWAGLRQGLMLQLVKLVTLVASYGIALLFYKPVSQQLMVWFPLSSQTGKDMLSTIDGIFPVQQMIYYSIAFALLFIVTGIVLRWFGAILNEVAKLPVLSAFNRLGGGILGLLKSGLIMLLLLVLAYALPIPGVHQSIDQSVLGSYAVKQSPEILNIFQGMMKKGPVKNPSETPSGNINTF